MLTTTVSDGIGKLARGDEAGVSPWLVITQDMIDRFGEATLDRDPMHIDPDWANQNAPFGGAIAFGFLTISLLTHLLRQAMGADANHPERGYYLNYGFDRLRLVSPVPAGARVRGRFKLARREEDERGRWLTTFDCTVEIEGGDRPALVAEWLSIWVPPDAAA